MDQYFQDSNIKICNIYTLLNYCKYYSIEYKDYFYIDRLPNAIYITFRSTQKDEDYLCNLKLGADNSIDIENGYTHFGYAERANMVKNIEEIYSQAVRDKKLLIIGGHSLGGAAASICAFNLLKNHPDSDNI